MVRYRPRYARRSASAIRWCGSRSASRMRMISLPISRRLWDEPMRMRTQVGIIGAGPAGLLLSHLLHLAGIDSVVLEVKSRDYVEKRVRAGGLEQPTVQLLDEVGIGERLHREGLRHGGIHLAFDGARHLL